MNKIKNWLISKILKEMTNSYAGFIKYVYVCMCRIISIVIDHHYDNKLGIETDAQLVSKDNLSLYKDAVIYQPTPYHKLEKMIDYLNLGPDDIFIDLGCGKGRVIFLVATQKLKKVMGLELKKELVDIAKLNLDNLKLNNTPIEIINADAATYDNSKDITVFFMFNPFGSATLTRVIDNIKNTLIANPRIIRIVYYVPAYRNLFDNQNWLVSEGEIDKTAIFVWHNILYLEGP